MGAIWLSPFFKSPMHDFGYDIEDFTDIHDEFGTMADFDTLSARAKELGIHMRLSCSLCSHETLEVVFRYKAPSRLRSWTH